MARPRYIQAQKFTLSGSGVTSSATSIVLSSMKLPDGATNIVTADLGDTATYPTYMTLEPGTSKEELISFTTITQNVGGTATLTGVVRGLAFVNPHAETSANKLAHAGGSVAVLSNASVLYQKIIDYIDAVSIAGATDASTTVKGIVEEATEAELVAGTGAGATGARLFISPANTGIVSTSAGAADVGKIPKLNAAGELSGTFMKLPVVRTYLTAGSPATWTKPAGLKYVIVEVQAGGGVGGAGVNAVPDLGGGGGGGGGYSRKLIAVASLGTTETVTIGASAASSSFGSHCSATAGNVGGSGSSRNPGGTGGTGSGGDVNLSGGPGEGSYSGDGSTSTQGGNGGGSFLGAGGVSTVAGDTSGNVGVIYGGGGSGGNGAGSGGAGAAGIVIVTEYYN